MFLDNTFLGKNNTYSKILSEVIMGQLKSINWISYT